MDVFYLKKNYYSCPCCSSKDIVQKHSFFANITIWSHTFRIETLPCIPQGEDPTLNFLKESHNSVSNIENSTSYKQLFVGLKKGIQCSDYLPPSTWQQTGRENFHRIVFNQQWHIVVQIPTDTTCTPGSQYTVSLEMSSHWAEAHSRERELDQTDDFVCITSEEERLLAHTQRVSMHNQKVETNRFLQTIRDKAGAKPRLQLHLAQPLQSDSQ